MGRKNYLFSHDDKGAEVNAVFYSLLESCDVVQLNPLDGLTDVLGKLKDNMNEDEITQLMPHGASERHTLSNPRLSERSERSLGDKSKGECQLRASERFRHVVCTLYIAICH